MADTVNDSLADNRPHDHDDPDRLGEILRQMERHIDHEVAASREFDRKIEHLLTMAVLLAGAGLAVFNFVRPPGPIQDAFVAIDVWFGVAGMTANIAALLFLINGYVGLPLGSDPQIDPGVDPDWLEAASASPEWSLEHILHSSIKGLKAASSSNVVENERKSAARRRGLFAGLSSVTLYAVAILIHWWYP